jgi:hypothetical protein
VRQRSTVSRVRRAASLGSIAVVVALVAGCSTPPWLGDAAMSTPVAPETTGPATATATATPVVNELAAGSATRTMEVGAITLTVDYWSTLSMDLWTASANKPLSFAVHATITPADGQKVYLSRVTATPVVADAGGALPGFDPLVDQATVAPGYLILDPYSYSQTFTLPAVDPAATSIVLDLRFELLQQATPESADYAKQTAVDTLTIAIAPE